MNKTFRLLSAIGLVVMGVSTNSHDRVSRAVQIYDKQPRHTFSDHTPKIDLPGDVIKPVAMTI